MKLSFSSADLCLTLMLYLVAVALGAGLLVAGSEWLQYAGYSQGVPEALLLLDYRQWLPVCAVVLATAGAGVSLLHYCRRRSGASWEAGLTGGLLGVLILVLTGAGAVHGMFAPYYWKNVLVIFGVSYLFPAAVRRLRS